MGNNNNISTGVTLDLLILHLENLKELNDGDGDIPVTVARKGRKTIVDFVQLVKLAEVNIMRKENTTFIYIDREGLVDNILKPT